MRKLNTLISAALCCLFLLHLVMGSFMVSGLGHNGGKILALCGIALLVIHIVLSGIATGRTLRRLIVSHRPWYSRENGLFWLRRLSGLAMVLLLFGHLGMFGTMVDDHYVLYEFTTPKLILQESFMTAFFLHLATNVRPLFLSLGWRQLSTRCRDMYVVLGVIYVFAVGAILFYYIGWLVS